MLFALVIMVAALVIALSIHEFAHALAAEYFGDPTARLLGRLTLNPVAHLDMWGSLLFLTTLIASVYSNSSFIFGWGKPVPVDLYNLRNPRRDGALIALAGPMSNLLTALLMSMLIRGIIFINNPEIANIFIPFFLRLMSVSVALAVFNLIPLVPLDGSKIILGIINSNQVRDVAIFLEKYSTIILVGLIFTDTINLITAPIMKPLLQIFFSISGL